ncbi:transposase [Lysinibacillus pakistanensis]|uniref:transposase n=1 Tax=Lysinibacillus pakistanensis TaxID=759811 RepID=UPI003D320AAE
MKVTQKTFKQSFHESYGTYGSLRVHKDLLNGVILFHKKAANIMRGLELCATQPRSYGRQQIPNHDALVYPRLY